MDIRPITNETELHQAVELFRSQPQFFYKEDVIRTYEDISAWLKSRTPGVEYFAGFQGGKLVACLGYMKDPQGDRVYHLSHFAVDKDLRRQGLGRQMLRFVEERLAALGARLIAVWTSPLDYTKETRAFYEAMGYVHRADIPDYWRDGDPLAFYTKKL